MRNSTFKPKSTWKKLRKVSKRRQIEGKIYLEKRKEFLKENPLCQIKSPDCTKRAVVIHHKKGRVGALFLDENFWAASCWKCNQYCEEEKQWAIENGHRLDRLSHEEISKSI